MDGRTMLSRRREISFSVPIRDLPASGRAHRFCLPATHSRLPSTISGAAGLRGLEQCSMRAQLLCLPAYLPDRRRTRGTSCHAPGPA